MVTRLVLVSFFSRGRVADQLSLAGFEFYDFCFIGCRKVPGNRSRLTFYDSAERAVINTERGNRLQTTGISLSSKYILHIGTGHWHTYFSRRFTYQGRLNILGLQMAIPFFSITLDLTVQNDVICKYNKLGKYSITG